jgi:hypothetical protein
MPSSLARIETPRAGRYLAQLCEHLDHVRQGSPHARSTSAHSGPPQVLEINRTDDHAVIAFAWGTCTLEATGVALVVRIDAEDGPALGQAENLIGHRIDTIGSRERLIVDWQPMPPPG